MAKYDGKVIINTELNNSGIPKGIKEIKGSLGGLKNVVSSLGGAIAGAFSVAALTKFSAKCIELGSNLEEVQNVVDVSFGAMSGMMEEFASNAITQFGMSELAAKKTGSTYMAMAKGLGVAESAAADMSLALTGLSGDVASFFNRDQEEAAKKLQGVFTGETEALKDLGVVMTQTNLKQYALTHGMNANIEAMSQAELVALRYAFVTDALSLASGDFVRTQDSWANQTRILSMQWQQFMGIIGQTLTTVLVPVIKVLNTIVSALINVAKAVQSVIAGLFGGSTGAVAEQNAAVAESALAGAAAENKLANATKAAGKEAKKALAGFDELNVLQSKSGGGSGSGSGGAASAGGISTGGLATPTGAEDAISPRLQAITEKLRSFIEPLKNIDLSPAIASFRNLGQSLLELGAIVTDHLEWVWFNILVPLSTWYIEAAAPAVVNTLAEAFRFLGAVLDPVYKGLQQLFGHLKPVFAFIGGSVLLVLQKWRELFQKLAKVFENKGPKITGIISNIGEIFGVIWSAVIQPVLEALKKQWSQTFDLLGDVLCVAIGWIIDWLYGLTEFIAGVFTGDWSRAWAGVGSIFEGAKEALVGIARALFKALGLNFDQIVAAGKNAFLNLKTTISNIFTAISTTVKGAVNGILGFLNGMISGLISGINTVIRALNRLKVEIPDWVPMFGGNTFGFNLKTLSTPKIPYLAKGAVLPANKPFLAMVGDQKHGTNIEAPLSTIQEAVAMVMEDYAAANLAGHEAVVAVLKEILEAVLGIEISDTVIGQAVQRYNARMAVVRGG